jgi:hypothetical protein
MAGGKDGPVSFRSAPLLIRLHEFAAQVDIEAHDGAIRKRIGDGKTLPTILELIQKNAAFQTFLDQWGSKGLIQLFLSLHLFNVIWIERQDALQAAARDQMVLDQLMSEIERVSLVTVDAAFASWKKWTELSVALADCLLDTMNMRIREAVSAENAESPER